MISAQLPAPWLVEVHLALRWVTSQACWLLAAPPDLRNWKTGRLAGNDAFQMFSGKSLDGQSIFGENNGFRALNDGFPPFFWIDSFREIIGKSSRIIRDLAHACIWMHCERCFSCEGLGLCPASPVLKQAWDLSFGYKKNIQNFDSSSNMCNGYHLNLSLYQIKLY